MLLKFPLEITGDGDTTSIRDSDGEIIAFAEWDGVQSGDGGVNDQLLELVNLANEAAAIKAADPVAD